VAGLTLVPFVFLLGLAWEGSVPEPETALQFMEQTKFLIQISGFFY
jgi:hypothetical protein